MKVGVIGLGKLGLPVALAIEKMGHEVKGMDNSPRVIDNILKKEIPYQEHPAEEWIKDSNIQIMSIGELVDWADFLFVAVQTPHDPAYEGITPMPDERVDFNYSYLVTAVSDAAGRAKFNKKSINLVVISTCLPTTFETRIEPYINEYVNYVYNPFFIAMGTAIDDFLKPEFVLIGEREEASSDFLQEFYSTIHDSPVYVTDITTAELIKVGYNTFIGMKIAYINTMMEICEKTGANVDDFSEALGFANQRIISTKYLSGGMGDGGGCHPRDNIAMSWLAQKLDLSHDIFEDIMKCREDQTKWLAEYAVKNAFEMLPPRRIFVMGREYKKETNLTVGSPALLLEYYLDKLNANWTELEGMMDPVEAGVFIIATNHDRFANLNFPETSIVIDPWGYIPDQFGVRVKRIGRNDGVHLH